MNDFNKVFGAGASPWNSQVIPAKDGLVMVQAAAALEHPTAADDFHSLAFASQAIHALLTQPGACGIKAVKAHNGHHHTEVWFAVDADGQILASDTAIALENGERCPPFC